MGKVLVWFVVVIVVMMVARLIAANKAQDKKPAARPGPRPAPSGSRRAPPPPGVEHMVRCAHCGIHLPRSEAVMLGGHTFCGPDHARLGVVAAPRHG